MRNRERVSVEVGAEVASLPRARAAGAEVSEGEIVARAVRAFELRALVAQVRS